jgi:hypothetical protein
MQQEPWNKMELSISNLDYSAPNSPNMTKSEMYPI